jgi:hypothetical protein
MHDRALNIISRYWNIKLQCMCTFRKISSFHKNIYMYMSFNNHSAYKYNLFALNLKV